MDLKEDWLTYVIHVYVCIYVHVCACLLYIMYISTIKNVKPYVYLSCTFCLHFCQAQIVKLSVHPAVNPKVQDLDVCHRFFNGWTRRACMCEHFSMIM